MTVTDFLLPAFTKLRADAFLVIAGGEDGQTPGYAAQIERDIDRLQLRQRVKLLGAIPPTDRWRVLDGAALFILPSLTENFGIVVPEAMSRGLPVIVTSGVQFAEHVVASGAGTVVPPDAGMLALALDAWLVDPAGRISAGEKGKQYVQQTFSWQLTAERLGGLYRRVLHQ